jgi:hypothetical protein
MNFRSTTTFAIATASGAAIFVADMGAGIGYSIFTGILGAALAVLNDVKHSMKENTTN